jgi:tripartite-type tricarboxylate transporter receptor subunit TctC
MTQRRTLLRATVQMTLALALAPGSSLRARAQSSAWPGARPIRLLVGQPAGYSPDIASRQLAEALSAELKQTIVVENKPGGGGALMLRELRNAAPDGYTLGSVFWNQMAVAPALVKQIDYHPAEDFAHVGIWSVGAQVVVVHPGAGLKSVAELVVQARARNPALNYASHGSGSPGHVFMALLQERAGMPLNHVPYKGADAVLAAVRGEVPVAITGVADAAPFIRTGQLQALAVTGPRRLALLPAVPTLTEAGQPGIEYGVWAGLVAPKGTPADTVQRLNAALRAAAGNPALREKREAAGALLQVGSPADMLQRVREELVFWRQLVERAGITAN